MKFAVPDPDEDDYVELDYSFSWSPGKNGVAGPSRRQSTPKFKPRSALGRAVYDWSDSDDEVDNALKGSWEHINGSASGIQQVSSKKNPMTSPLNLMDDEEDEDMDAVVIRKQPIAYEPSEYDKWLKSTEEKAFREGHRIAHSRRAQLRELALNTRAELNEQQGMQDNQNAEEVRRLLEGLAIKQNKEEEEAKRLFKERQARLWADIDAAIKRTEDLEAQKRAQQQSIRKQAEDAILARQQEESNKKAEVERKEKEAAEKKREEELTAARLKQEEEKKKEEVEAKKKMGESKGSTGSEWKKWVDRQKKMKLEVIEPVKKQREVKQGLRAGMRLITRGLGQVVNTKESILKVTNDIADILNAQLPSCPSPSSPTTLTSSQPYSYLLSHLSKALVKQAESEVSAKKDAAFPLARITVGLLLRGHAAFGEVLFSRLVKKCPWVIPFYPSSKQFTSREEYEKSTGRATDESSSDYIQRMSGICSLYFAILQTSISSLIPTLPTPPTPEQLLILIPLPLRLPASWTWIANALKDPMPGLAPIAHLVGDWIEVSAYEVGKVYGEKQVQKIFESIQREGVEGGKIKGDSESTRRRLTLLFNDKKGSTEPAGKQWSS